MRCFAAIELDPAVRAPLIKLVRELLPRDREVRWCTEGQLHVTLKFLGEVQDGQIAAVCKAVEAASRMVSPFEIRVVGLGAFPAPHNPRVMWVGVEDPQQGCERWVAEADPFFEKLGFPPEQRAYRPHLTLGRSKGPGGGRLMRRLLDELKPPTGPAMTVREVVLFESRLAPTGAVYTPRFRARLSEG